MVRLIKLFIALSMAFVVTACVSTNQHLKDVRSDAGERVSVGKVQKEIRVGMPSSAVVEILGSPNMVTTDELRREVWVYDKVATEQVYSTNNGGLSALILGGFAGAGGGFNKNTGAQASSQRTLTIVIKFDEAAKVRDFHYRTSSF